MYRYRLLSAGVVLVAAATFAVEATAEIYKWVDEQGNIHFGDKPLDRNQADKAEQVEVIESYKPSVRTPEEQEAYEQEQQAMKRRREIYQQEDLEARKLVDDRAREEKAEICAALAKDIRKLTSMELVDGVRTYYYLKDEDGKSVTSGRQREIVEELRQKYAAAGCE